MAPTLQVDDTVLVLKNTFVEIDISTGDIVVFYSPETEFKENYIDEFLESIQIWKLTNDDTYLNTALIKRVVGNSGDEVTVKESGEVYVNGNKALADRNVDELRNDDIDAGYFVNPTTGYMHVYIAKTDSREEAIKLYNNNLNGSFYDRKTIVRIK